MEKSTGEEQKRSLLRKQSPFGTQGAGCWVICDPCRKKSGRKCMTHGRHSMMCGVFDFLRDSLVGLSRNHRMTKAGDARERLVNKKRRRECEDYWYL